MNKIIIVAVMLMAAIANADQTISVTTAQDVSITLAPNGPLDAPPIWSKTGTAGLVINPGSLSGKAITNGAGTSVVTIVGVSQGISITNSVTVVVVAAATSLGVTAIAVPK